ncbi:hypothetical protein IDJ75_18190 [Mucilaginibacter rigui]|uniref:DUF4919 domain-containing protein n=1 Tax=Mucilaginibacter rigui TaxID=534635 RepID=A0ABR7X9I5_9SPHI|nr:hypothetical protein [Mucilaginibacter rigui]MBD1387224.1 hypothetical protein [Mucilaginibacter rigui]
MKVIIGILLLFCAVSVKSQNVENHQVEPKGIYKEINTDRDSKIMGQLMSESSIKKQSLIDSVQKNPNVYIPPVIYALSYALFQQNKKDDAIYWFYLAQLRARYDVNRCTDKTASAAQYNQLFGPSINEYAFAHLDILEKTIPKVITFVESNEELYDQRWINLSGMDAMSAGLGGKAESKNLSINKAKWPKIKSETIKDYSDGFNEALASFKKKN